MPQGHDERSLKARALDGVVWSALRLIAIVLTRFVVLMVLARLLTPEEFGLMGAALVIVAFSNLFYQLGVAAAIIQRPTLTENHVKSGLTLSIGTSVVVAGAVFVLAPHAQSFFQFEGLDQVVRVVALSFPVIGFAAVTRSLLERELDFKSLAAIDTAAYVLGYVAVGIGAALLGAGVWSLVAAHITTSVLTALALAWVKRSQIAFGINRVAIRELIGFGGGDTIAKIFGAVAAQADNAVAGRWLGAAALGVYGRAFQLVAFPVNQLNAIVNQVVFSTLSRFQDSKRALGQAFRRGTTFVVVLFGPVGVLTSLMAPEVVHLILGPRWNDAVMPIRILAIGMVLRGSLFLSDSIARASGAIYRRAWRQMVFALAVVGGAWIGQRWGITGIAVGVLCALSLNYWLMSNLSLQVTQLPAREFVKAHLPGLWLTGVAAGIVLASQAAFRVVGVAGSFPRLALATCATIVGVLAMVRMIPRPLGPDWPWIRQVLGDATLGRITRFRSDPSSGEVGDLDE